MILQQCIHCASAGIDAKIDPRRMKKEKKRKKKLFGADCKLDSIDVEST